MPTRLKNLKATAQIISKELGHDMRQFERTEGTAWAAFCKGCGRQMMVDPEDGAGYWGTAVTEDCGPVQPEVPPQCADIKQVFDQLTEQFDGSALESQADAILENVERLGLAEQLEIIELKCEPEPEAINTLLIEDLKPSWPPAKQFTKGKLVRFPDGTTYETRSDGWRRVKR